MKLAELFQNMDCPGALDSDARDVDICKIVSDSHLALEGTLFVAVPGELQDGNAYIDDAVERGARAVLVKRGTLSPELNGGIVRIECDDPKGLLPVLLNRFYADPCTKIPVVGITGTNGKTTTAYLMESIYHASDKRCGVIGTVNHRFAGRVIAAKNTTPSLADNFCYLDQMIAAGIDACVMEVSSHALVQGRVEGIAFSEVVFTNLTSDHLDYHKNQEDYFLAKARLFDGSRRIGSAIINGDDHFGNRLVNISASSVVTYGIQNEADVMAEDVSLSLDGSQFVLRAFKERLVIKTPLIGKHNIYNILAAVSICLKQGFSLNQIKKGVEALDIVPGRLERIKEAQDLTVLVDYAHTEDALKNVLESIRESKPARIITVFGCGGDRDKTKRPKMAAVVDVLSDVAIVTNDNPRTEDPQAIARDIEQGFKSDRYEVVLDRKEAITKSLQIACPGDCVLIAGKGHEDYQIFKDQTVHFDDRETVRRLLKG